jgi:hypothetical protein
MVRRLFSRAVVLSLAILVTMLPQGSGAQEAPADTAQSVIDTEAAWQRVSVARDLARQNRHHEAVADYLQALANDARLVKVVAKEIAYQKLWREDADKAIFYFHRYLARHPGEENRDVRRGLALAYSWSGRQREAIELYAQLVKEDPADEAARVGLGRCLIWNNELKPGFAVLREIEKEFPADSAGRRQSSNFLLTYLDSYTTPLAVDVRFSWDSDDLDIQRYSATGAFTVMENNLALAMPAVAIYRLPGQGRITAPRLGGGLVGTLAHNWAFHAYGWLDMFRSSQPLYGSPEKLSWDRLGGDLWLTWRPAARWRIDFGGNSTAVETFYALNNRLHYEQANLSADWRFARGFTAGVAGNLADYSDGNTKQKVSANLRWKREGKWELHLGPDLTYMDFSQAYPGGYWAPDWVRSAGLGLTLKTRGQRTTYLLNGSLGREKETGAEAMTVGGISGRVGWRFGGSTLLAVEAGYSKSSLTADSGYNRTFAGISLKAAF